jgi:hypothetical protein
VNSSHWRSTSDFWSVGVRFCDAARRRVRPLSGEVKVEKPVSGPRPMKASCRLPWAFGSCPVPMAQSPPPWTVPVSPNGAVPSARHVSPPSTETEPWSVPLEAPFVPQL